MTLRTAPVLAALVTVLAAPALAAWTPGDWIHEEVLEMTTDGPEEGPYEFKVWLVVIDDIVYLRLGSRAAERFEASKDKPYIGIRIAGQFFPRVRAESTPEMAARVDKAMSDKYWSDVFIRYFSHPLTLRLVPPE